jgi:PPOX class probable F420-dependent enzyme
MSLTTFRNNGEPVSTPVWFAQEGETLYVLSTAEAGKVKRIRRNAQVEVAPCMFNGTLLGDPVEAMASVLPGDHAVKAIHALNRKYGFQKWVYDLYHLMRGVHRVYLEISPM